MTRQEVTTAKNQAARLRKKIIKNSTEDNSAAAKSRQKPKRRRPPQKKKEAEEEPKKKRHNANGTQTGASTSNSPSKKHVQQSRQHKQFGAFRSGQDHEKKKIYERAPRLLPPIDGVKALNNSEVQRDLKQINTLLSNFETQKTALFGADLSASFPSGLYVDGDNKSWENIYVEQYAEKEDNEAQRKFQLTPEELVESIPKCRRAVHMTQRELLALKHEYEDLERNYMRLRCKYIWQLREMKRMKHQQKRVLRTLHQQVEVKAKELESSRRRTSALQDLMNELESRGNRILSLSRERNFFKRELAEKWAETPPGSSSSSSAKTGSGSGDKEMPVFDPEEFHVGDPVSTPFGKGVVQGHRTDTSELIVGRLTRDRDSAAVAYVRVEDAVLIDWEVTFDREERKLKQSFFEKLGAVINTSEVTANGLGMASSSSTMGSSSNANRLNRRPSGSSSIGGATGGDLASDGSEFSSDEDDSSDDSSSDQGDTNDLDKEELEKKRKLKHAKRSARLIDFTACSIPIVPRGIAQLVSPLSELPERTAALGPESLQWMTSYLPQKMVEWEHERYESLELKAEIERLRFLLQKAESEKVEAQKHAVDQVDSMNQLVIQLEKLRESVHGNGTEKCNCDSADKRKPPAKATKAQRGKATTSTTSRSCNNNNNSNNNRKHQQQAEDDDDQDDDATNSVGTNHDDEDEPLTTTVTPVAEPATTSSSQAADPEDLPESNSNSPMRTTTTRRSLRRRRAVKSSPRTKR